MPESKKVLVEIPASLADELAAADRRLLTDLLQRGLRDLQIERALDQYSAGGISFAAAAEAAGVSQSALARAAYVRGMEPPFDETMVADEVQ
jgi:hypothetical protein